MGRKPKVNYELKIQAVKAYLTGKKGTSEICNELDISTNVFYGWLSKYNLNGEEGLITKSKNRYYSDEIKHRAVIDYLSGMGSTYTVCNKYNISSHSLLRKWIMKYNNHEITKSHNAGGNKFMIKGRKTSYEERVGIVAFCMENNDNYQLASNKYKVSYQQVYTWVKKYKENGYGALIDNRGKSKKIGDMNDTEKLAVQIKLLEAQNKRLEMENAFLKKLKEVERRRK